MTVTTSKDLKILISAEYAKKVQAPAGCCSADDPCNATYPLHILDSMPESVVSFGCGVPTAIGALNVGETVLDLGSGAGLDCFLAAKEVGPEGAVIGVDFTPVMIERAYQNKEKLKVRNVSFKLGDIESLPVESSSVDVVISNCVVNLAPDKDAVFNEAYRVLRSAGRLMVSDILLTRPATEEEFQDMELLTECISGSIPAHDYISKIEGAGFTDVACEGTIPTEGDRFWYSASITAKKP